MSNETNTTELPEDDNPQTTPTPEETVEIEKPEDIDIVQSDVPPGTIGVSNMSVEDFKEQFLDAPDVPHTDVPREPAGPVKEKPAYDRKPVWPQTPAAVLEKLSYDGSGDSSILDEWAIQRKAENAIKDLGARGLEILRMKLEAANANFPEPAKCVCDHDECEPEECEGGEKCEGCDCIDEAEESYIEGITDAVEHVKDRWATVKKYAAIVAYVVGGIIGGSAGTVALTDGMAPPTPPPVIEAEGPELLKDAVVASLYYELVARSNFQLTRDDDGNTSFIIHKMSIDGNSDCEAVLKETKDGHVRVTLER